MGSCAVPVPRYTVRAWSRSAGEGGDAASKAARRRRRPRAAAGVAGHPPGRRGQRRRRADWPLLSACRRGPGGLRGGQPVTQAGGQAGLYPRGDFLPQDEGRGPGVAAFAGPQSFRGCAVIASDGAVVAAHAGAPGRAAGLTSDPGAHRLRAGEGAGVLRQAVADPPADGTPDVGRGDRLGSPDGGLEFGDARQDGVLLRAGSRVRAREHRRRAIGGLAEAGRRDGGIGVACAERRAEGRVDGVGADLVEFPDGSVDVIFASRDHSGPGARRCDMEPAGGGDDAKPASGSPVSIQLATCRQEICPCRRIRGSGP